MPRGGECECSRLCGSKGPSVLWGSSRRLPQTGFSTHYDGEVRSLGALNYCLFMEENGKRLYGQRNFVCMVSFFDLQETAGSGQLRLNVLQTIMKSS